MRSELQQLLHRTTFQLLLIPGAAFLAILPLLIRGPSCGHDFDFHLLSWLEASSQFAHLTFPHWAYTPAWNAGEPRFVFYPPISWSLGAALGLFLPWKLVPASFTWIALTLSGLTFYRLSRRYTGPNSATLAAILYLANPYMLFTAYERTAFAELLAAAWLPLLLAATLPTPIPSRLCRPEPMNPGPFGLSNMLQIAFPLALIWLTNAPAAVMATYALAFVAVVRLLTAPIGIPSAQATHGLPARTQSTRLHLALTASAGTALGLSLAAFYILPAAYERRFVQIQMVIIEGMRVSDHFLFHHMPGRTFDDRFHDAVVRTASVVALTLLAAIAAAFFAVALRPSSKSHSSEPGPQPVPRLSVILPLALLTVAIAFLLTPGSLPIWNHLPELAFLQFPWRLTSLLGLIFAFLVALSLPEQWLSPPSKFPGWLLPLFSFLLATVLIAPAWHIFRQRCDAEDALPARVALYRSNLGTEPTDEYTPIHADPDSLHPHDPPFWLIVPQPGPAAANAPAPLDANPGPAPAHLTLILPTPEYLVLNRRHYPAWQIRLNGTVLQPTSPELAATRDDGLITLLLPAGSDTIDLTLIRTPDETAGLAISAVALLLTFALLIVAKRPHRLED